MFHIIFMGVLSHYPRMSRMRKRIHMKEEPRQIPFQIRKRVYSSSQGLPNLSLSFSLPPFPPSAFSRDRRESRSLPRLTPTFNCVIGMALHALRRWGAAATHHSVRICLWLFLKVEFLILSHHLSKLYYSNSLLK